MSKEEQQFQQYPQQYPPPQPGGAYYAPGQQPPPGYPGQPQYAVGAQQPTVVVVNAPPPVESFVCHFVLSCFTFWCCGWLFGLVAFILAVVAQSKAPHEPQSARQLGKASLGVSIAGIIIPVLVTVIVIVVYVIRAKQAAHDIHGALIGALCKYPVKGNCYATRELSLTPHFCPRNGFYNSLDNYCYYEL